MELNPAPNNTVFIPLGIRCSAAFVIGNELGKRMQAFPFDWIDTSVENITKILEMNVTGFTKYLNEVQSHTQRHPDGTYFPHDIDYVDGKFTKEITGKYVRRFIRLKSVLSSDAKIVFLTVFKNLADSPANYGLLTDKITSIRSNNIFITVNLFDHDVNIGNHYNFYIPVTGSNFSLWEKQIGNKIKQINI